MKSRRDAEHPIVANAQKIKQDGIVVFHNICQLPTHSEPFTSPDYVICIVHRGTMELLYDDMPDMSERRIVAVIFPNHTITPLATSDDFCNTVIVVNATMLDDPMLQVVRQFQYRYEPQPSVRLDEHDYKVLTKIADVMHETSLSEMPEKRMLMMRQLECFLRMLGYYRQRKIGDKETAARYGQRFLAQVARHFREHRDVAFYAELACVTPHYFTTAIRKETGHSPAYWIHRHVVSQAQMLLHVHRDLTIQAIADQLGFAEQQAFSRYFKRETGMSPSQYRDGPALLP